MGIFTNEEEHFSFDDNDMDNNQIENTQLMKNEIDEYFSKRFLIQKKQWYNLIINIR